MSSTFGASNEPKAEPTRPSWPRSLAAKIVSGGNASLAAAALVLIPIEVTHAGMSSREVIDGLRYFCGRADGMYLWRTSARASSSVYARTSDAVAA
jgi:hypothetical protein